jgi:hypothetical protein
MLVELATLQAVSYIMGSLGVFVAAVYYVYNMRNAEKLRRRDIVFQRLQSSQLQFFEAYGYLLGLRDWETYEEFREKHYGKPEVMPKLWMVLNHFNALGLLLKDGLATPEQIFQQYLPISIIIIYERYKGEIIVSRLTPSMEVHNPDAYKGFELLYREAKKRYPKTPSLFSKEALLEHARRIDELMKTEAGF